MAKIKMERQTVLDWNDILDISKLGRIILTVSYHNKYHNKTTSSIVQYYLLLLAILHW